MTQNVNILFNFLTGQDKTVLKAKQGLVIYLIGISACTSSARS